MPAAAIGAVGSVAGGVASGKGASNAAKIQQQTAQQQIAAAQAMYNTNKDLITPTVNSGNAAQTQQNALLGLGGDPTSALATLAATPGYQYTVNQALKATDANAYASGLGNSGAAEKALQDRAANLASTNYNNYNSQLGAVADRGVSATNALMGQGNIATAANNASTSSAGAAASADAAYQGTNLASILKGVANSAGQAFTSSYGTTTPLANNGTGTTMQNGSTNNGSTFINSLLGR